MTKMLWIDDVREPPCSGWDTADTAGLAIQMLLSRDYDVVSFDHDLGLCQECMASECETCVHNGTGYDVVKWLEETCFLDETFPIPTLAVHSDNGPGRKNISLAIQSINNLVLRRLTT